MNVVILNIFLKLLSSLHDFLNKIFLNIKFCFSRKNNLPFYISVILKRKNRVVGTISDILGEN